MSPRRTVNRIRATVDTLFGRRRSVEYQIGNFTAVLPPGHKLPEYQRAHPTYDRYFRRALERLEVKLGPFTVIDVGANVGDTALAVVSSAPSASVICVEGSPEFFELLQVNTGSLENEKVIRGFVTPGDGQYAFSGNASTGHLVSLDARTGLDVKNEFRTVSPEDLVALAQSDLVIWKSDTDGMDMPILVSGWECITGRCSVLWLEFDPILTPPEATHQFLSLLESSGHDVVVFDNYGQRMLRLPGTQAPGALSDLTRWLVAQHEGGNRRIHYFDVWIAPPALIDQMYG